MDESVNAVITHDGNVVGYAFMEPYEIGCIERIEDRCQAILENTIGAMPTHQPVNPGFEMPVDPRVEPVTAYRRVMDFILELDGTTDVTVDETNRSINELRETIGNDPLETSEDLLSDSELYRTLVDTAQEIASANPDVNEIDLQRELEDAVKVQSVDVAVERKRSEYLS